MRGYARGWLRCDRCGEILWREGFLGAPEYAMPVGWRDGEGDYELEECEPCHADRVRATVEAQAELIEALTRRGDELLEEAEELNKEAEELFERLFERSYPHTLVVDQDNVSSATTWIPVGEEEKNG